MEFTARTTVTRFCGDSCAKRAYKQRLKSKKINQSNQQTKIIKEAQVKSSRDISKLEYLNPTDAARLLNCSRVYIYELMDSNKLCFAQLSPKKRLIKRIDIDAYLTSLQSLQGRKVISTSELPFDLNNCFTMGEAQEYYNISEKGLYDIIKRHSIRKQKVGKFVFVEKIELDKILAK